GGRVDRRHGGPARKEHADHEGRRITDHQRPRRILHPPSRVEGSARGDLEEASALHDAGRHHRGRRADADAEHLNVALDRFVVRVRAGDPDAARSADDGYGPLAASIASHCIARNADAAWIDVPRTRYGSVFTWYSGQATGSTLGSPCLARFVQLRM